MKSRFNKSEIMKAAHRIFRNSWCTMSQALKEAWRRVKVSLKEREANEGKAVSFTRSAKDIQNERAYRNVTFGRNGWRVDYGYRKF